MNSTPGKLIWWEMAGALFIILAGSAMHFAFEWSGFWRPLAVVAAVNESVWEHLKLAFWPGIAWAGAEWIALAERRHLIWSVKGLSLLVNVAVIVLLFQGYTAVLKDNLLALDIGVFCLAVILGQILSFWLLRRRRLPNLIKWIGFLMLLLELAAFSLLTYFPPELDLFRDSRDGTIGIPAAVT